MKYLAAARLLTPFILFMERFFSEAYSDSFALRNKRPVPPRRSEPQESTLVLSLDEIIARMEARLSLGPTIPVAYAGEESRGHEN